MILLRCACGKKLRLRPEHAGRTGRCPACGREIRVPDRVSAPEPAPPPKARPARAPSRAPVPRLDPPEPSGSDRMAQEPAGGPRPMPEARTLRVTPSGGAARPAVRPRPSTPMPISREARTVPEPIRPPSGPRAAWQRRASGSGAEDAATAGAETQRVRPNPALSVRKTGPRTSGTPSPRRHSSSSGDETVKVAVGDGDGGDGDDSAAIPAAASAFGGRPGWALTLAEPAEEGSSTIQVRASESGEALEPEEGSPWYENPALVTLLLGLVYPVGVAGTLLSATWATRPQKAAALLSVALLSAGAVVLLLLGR